MYSAVVFKIFLFSSVVAFSDVNEGFAEIESLALYFLSKSFDILISCCEYIALDNFCLFLGSATC